MNSRKYKSDINELIEKGKAIMNASDDSKYLMRVFAVNMVLSGSEVSKVSEMAGVVDATIYKWIKQLSPIECEQELTLADIEAIQKENLRLKQEIEILKKAMTIFARKQMSKN